MDLIIISGDKVKITLNKSDVALCGLDPGVISGRRGVRRQTVNRILKYARADFISKGGKSLKVECFPGRDGGCELFVSRLEREEREVFVFTTSDALLSYVQKSGNNSLPRGGKAYRYKNAYYLDLPVRSEKESGLLCEFAKKAKDGCSLFLEEHGEPLGKEDPDGENRLKNGGYINDQTKKRE